MIYVSNKIGIPEKIRLLAGTANGRDNLETVRAFQAGNVDNREIIL
jgi:hypothetical protein